MSDDRRPFAVCAPGMRPLAELALLLAGEQPIEVRESQFIEGRDVYVITPPDFSEITPELVFTPPPSVSSILQARALARAMVPPLPLPVVLSSVI